MRRRGSRGRSRCRGRRPACCRGPRRAGPAADRAAWAGARRPAGPRGRRGRRLLGVGRALLALMGAPAYGLLALLGAAVVAVGSGWSIPGWLGPSVARQRCRASSRACAALAYWAHGVVEERRDLQQVGVGVEDVGRLRLAEDVLQQRLEPGEALALGRERAPSRRRSSRSSRCSSVIARFVATSSSGSANAAQLLDARARRRRRRRLPTRAAAAERAERRPRGLRERAEVVEKRAAAAPTRERLRERRALAVGGLAEQLQRRAQLAQEAREALELARAGRRSAPREIDAVSRASRTKRLTSVRLSASAPDDALGVGRQLADRRGAARRGCASTLSVSRSAGLARRIVSLRSSPRAASAGAELAEQDREALAVGPAHDVVDEVGGHRRRRCARPGCVAPAASCSRSCPAGSRRSTRRSATAGASRRTTSARRSPKPVSVDLDADERAVGLAVELERLILPARTPATLTSAPSIRPKALSSSTV